MQVRRLFTIVNTLARYQVHTLLNLPRITWIIGSFSVFQRSAKQRFRHTTRGQRLRMALEELGPIFVKFGQVLSTRPDLLPEDVVVELSKLQDQVPPFASDVALRLIHTHYGKPATQVFQTFSPVALASASVAQVHAATLPEGDHVVVKIVRPGIKEVICADIKMLYLIARLLSRYWEGAKRLCLHEVVAEFEKTIHCELDMQREAANASQLRRNFKHSALLYVPNIYWDYCRVNVLVLERIYGVHIADIATLRAQGVNLKVMAERGVKIFFTQVFRDKFFHADMHPGNIFMDISNPQKPKYLGVDFGIMGCLSDENQYYLAQNFLAFFNRDYLKVAQLHIDAGWVKANTRVDALESTIRTVCEPIFNKPLSDISFALVLIRLFQVARQFDMEVQPQLVLLQKTLLNVEGLGRQLYPKLNLWETAKPYLEKLMKRQLGIAGALKKVREQYPLWLHKFPHLPHLIVTQLEQTSDFQQQLAQLRADVSAVKKQQHKWCYTILVVVLIGTLLWLLKRG